MMRRRVDEFEPPLERPTRARVRRHSGGPVPRAPTGPRTRRFPADKRHSSPSWCSTRVSRAARAGIFDGDLFSIDLKVGPYAAYTRAGYIEGGNIQVEELEV